MSDLSHGLTNGRVVVEQLAVASGIPLSESGQLLRNSVEQADDDADRNGLHVGAELVDRDGIRHTVVAIELHLLPDGQENGRQHEDGGPVLETISAVHARVQSREFLEDILLQLTPHIGHGALDLEVDHDRGNDLAKVLGVLVIDLAVQLLLGTLLLDHGDVKRQIVSQDEFEGLADDWHLLLNVVAVSGLENLGNEGGTLKVVVNKALEGTVNVLVEVLGQCLHRDTLTAHIQLLSANLKVDRLLVR